MINKRKIGFYANGAFQSLPIENTCDILLRIGYDAVELDRWWIERSRERLSDEVRSIERSGLSLSEVVLQLDYIDLDPDARECSIRQTEDYILRCSAAGATTFNLFTGPRPWIAGRITVGEDISMTDAWSMLFEAFDRLVPLAEGSGAMLAVENVWGMLCHDFFTMEHLVNHYASPNLGVNFDPSHDQLAGNCDMEFLLRQWGRDRIKHVHLKDAAGSQKRGRVLFPPLGEGLVDWAGFARGLDAIGYDGVLSVEYEADAHLSRRLGGDWIKAAEESYSALHGLL